ncbi:MAG: DUF6516 family protein [Halobacteriales archaeon]
MAVGGGGTELVVDTHLDLSGDRFARVMVRLVPESETYPEGVKYSMHYGTYDGETILRYDNAHATKGHERHTPDGTEEIDFPGWRELFARFRNEVTDHERQHD